MPKMFESFINCTVFWCFITLTRLAAHNQTKVVCRIVNAIDTCVEATDCVPEDCEHRPRLCHLRLSRGCGSYGFTMYSGTSTGQFIGDVDHHSPAECAGLLSGDRVIEVNGVNVETDSHSEVIFSLIYLYCFTYCYSLSLSFHT